MRTRRRYIGSIVESLGTAAKGLRLSGRHLRRGSKSASPVGIEHPDYFKMSERRVTIQYPAQRIPVPDTGRYRLHMETDDCIGCDKCARICPVDCITIETFRADGDLGKTSDGTVKRLYLPVFDIDMAKCMYCGLCTTVCPTECLTMTKVYDFSEYDRDNLLYHFGGMSPDEEREKRAAMDLVAAAKKAAAVPPPPAPEAGGETAAPATPPVRRKPIMTRKPPEEGKQPE